MHMFFIVVVTFHYSQTCEWTLVCCRMLVKGNIFALTDYLAYLFEKIESSHKNGFQVQKNSGNWPHVYMDYDLPAILMQKA